MNLNATILGQAISFFIFVWFCMKYVWPPIMLAIETRQKEIKESLFNVKTAQDELSVIQQKIINDLKVAKEKSIAILKEANQRKLHILEVAKKQAIQDSKKIFVNTQSEIKIEIVRARENLHKEIVDLSFLIAEKIIKKNISRDNHKELVDKLVISLSQVKR